MSSALGFPDPFTDGVEAATEDFRFLRIRDSDGNEAPTVCFEGAAYFDVHEHRLICGHLHETLEPEACRNNCKLSMRAETKVKNKVSFVCEDPKCVKLRQQAKVVFMPKKRSAVGKGGLHSKEARDAVAKSRLQRELAKLAIAGTAALLTAESGTRRKRRAVDDVHFGKHDAPVGAANERQKPNLYAAKGKESKRNENAEMFSMREDTYEEMVAEEGGVIHHEEATILGRVPLRTDPDFDEYGDLDSETLAGIGPIDEGLIKHCICECPSDGSLLMCVKCKCYYHPGCLGKGLFSKERYEDDNSGAAHRADASHFRSEGFDFTCGTCDEYHARQNTVTLGNFEAADDEPISTYSGPQLRRKTNLASQFSRAVADKRREQEQEQLQSKKTAADKKRCEQEQNVAKRNTIIANLVGCSVCVRHIVGTQYRCVECADAQTQINFCTPCGWVMARHSHQTFDVVPPTVSIADIEFLQSEAVGMAGKITGAGDVVAQAGAGGGVGDVEMKD